MLGATCLAWRPTRVAPANGRGPHKAWEKAINKDMGIDGRIIFSQHQNARERRRSALGQSQNCLLAAGVSTVGVLFLMSRWAFVAREAEGFSEDHSRLAAAFALRSIISMCTKAEDERSTTIQLTNAWRCRWRRPQPNGICEVHLRMAGGMLDLSPLRDLAAGNGRHPMTWAWWRAMQGPLGLYEDHLVEIGTFFERCVGSGVLKSVVRQLCWALSLKVDVSLGHLLTKKKTSLETNMLAPRWKTVEDGLACPFRARQFLAEYISARKDAPGGHDIVSSSTDKASVVGMPLANIMFALPSNIALCCPPQAPPVFGMKGWELPPPHPTPDQGLFRGLLRPSGGGCVYLIGFSGPNKYTPLSQSGGVYHGPGGVEMGRSSLVFNVQVDRGFDGTAISSELPKSTKRKLGGALAGRAAGGGTGGG